MTIRNISSRLHALPVSLLVTNTSFFASSVPQLCELELTWKNVLIDGKKIAMFSFFNDSRGVMWLGTNSRLYFYDGSTTHSVGENEFFGTQIYSIIAKDNKLFLGSNNGLLTYDYLSGIVNPYPTVTPKEIRTLLLIYEKLWIDSLNDIYQLDFCKRKIIDLSGGLPHKSVYSLLLDSRGIVYASTYNGLARWNTNSRTFQLVNMKMAASTPGFLFVNSFLESADCEDINIGSHNIKSLSKCNNGHILIGTDNGVFDMYEDTIKLYRHDSRLELSLTDNETWCIHADPRLNIWVGHRRGFSISSNSSSIRTIKLSTLTHCGEGNEIHLIRKYSRNNLWLAETNGVIKLSDDGQKWYSHSDSPNSLSLNQARSTLEDSEKRTDAGINRFNSKSENFDVFHIADEKGEHNPNWVYSLIEDENYFCTGSFLWGVKVLVNNDWALFFGGGNGILRPGNSDATTGFDRDNVLAVGETYV